MYANYENNKVFINGRIISDFKYSHVFLGEKFYEFEVEVARKSGIYDIIPVVVSERLMDITQDYAGRVISVTGQYRSYNKRVGCRTSLILSVFACEIEFEEYPCETYENNIIRLNGVICKYPVYRVTPGGRDIADMLLAVNRNSGKSDYIPCICWGRNAIYSSGLTVGTKLSISGRVQSREYTKTLPDGIIDVRVAYEVSVSQMEVVGCVI